jgi:hypothetical protein
MIISKVMEFLSFNKNLEKLKKFDRSACLGIVYDSNIGFELFLIGSNFLGPVIVMTRQLTLKSRLREVGGPPSLSSVTGRQLTLRGGVESGGRDPPLTRPLKSGGLRRAPCRPALLNFTVNFKREKLVEVTGQGMLSCRNEMFSIQFCVD